MISRPTCPRPARGRFERLTLGLALGFTLCLTPGCGIRSIHQAAMFGDLNELRTRLARGESVEARDDRGLTPLGIAATWGEVEAMRLLIAAGADVDAASPDGLTPLSRVIEAMRLLADEAATAESDADRRAIEAMLETRQAAVEALIDAGANVEAGGANGPLFDAASAGMMPVVERLLAAGADPGGRFGGHAPLAAAALGCHPEVARRLIAAGAEVEGRRRPMTPMFAAIISDCPEVMGILADAGPAADASPGAASDAAPSDTEETGPLALRPSGTLLDFALRSGRPAAVEWLRARSGRTQRGEPEGRSITFPRTGADADRARLDLESPAIDLPGFSIGIEAYAVHTHRMFHGDDLGPDEMALIVMDFPAMPLRLDDAQVTGLEAFIRVERTFEVVEARPGFRTLIYQPAHYVTRTRVGGIADTTMTPMTQEYALLKPGRLYRLRVYRRGRSAYHTRFVELGPRTWRSGDGRLIGTLQVDRSTGAYAYRLTVDGRETRYPMLEALGQIPHFSPDGRHLAFFARRGRQWIWVIDGAESQPYANVGLIDDEAIHFSPDSRRHAYLVRPARKQPFRLVIDGALQPPADVLLADALTFSRDSRHVAYGIEVDGRWHIVIDGERSPPIETFDALGPTGRIVVAGPGPGQFTYVAVPAPKDRGDPRVEQVVVDHVAGPSFDDVDADRLVFDGEGRRVLYPARKGEAWVVVHGEAVIGEHEVVGAIHPLAGTARFAYVAQAGGRQWMVVDGAAHTAYDAIHHAGSPFWRAADEVRVVYVARRATQEAVVVDGQPVEWVDRVQLESVRIDADGVHARVRRAGRWSGTTHPLPEPPA